MSTARWDDFNVYLNGKWIDRLCFLKGQETSESVKKSLINHDGYDTRIEVRKCSN